MPTSGASGRWRAALIAGTDHRAAGTRCWRSPNRLLGNRHSRHRKEFDNGLGRGHKVNEAIRDALDEFVDIVNEENEDMEENLDEDEEEVAEEDD
jgi:hypothetical protein